MLWGLLFCLALVFLPGVAAGLVAIIFAVSLLFLPTGLSGSDQWVLLLSFILAYPLAAYVTGAVLDRLMTESEQGRISHGKSAARFALLFTLALMLQSNVGIGYFCSVAEALVTGSVTDRVGAWLALMNAAVFCGLVSSAALACGILLFEIPFRWTLSASGVGDFSYLASSWRIVVVLILVSLSLQLCIGLFVDELHPRNWLLV